MTERADASGCIPSPGEGKGLGMGLRPFLMKGRWDGLEHPSRGLAIVIRGFILCVAQFVIRIQRPLFASEVKQIKIKNDFYFVFHTICAIFAMKVGVLLPFTAPRRPVIFLNGAKAKLALLFIIVVRNLGL